MTRSTKIIKYVSRRLFQGVPIILAIIVINFFLLNLAEGDAVDVLAGEAGSATPEYMAQLRAKFGLDQPLPVQLLVYLKNVLALDLGYSFRHDMPVSDLIFDRFFATGLLMTCTILLAVGFGVLLGLLAAMRLNTWKDAVITVFALITWGKGIPTYFHPRAQADLAQLDRQARAVRRQECCYRHRDKVCSIFRSFAEALDSDPF